MVTILRIGHRIKRDKRITTHLALVARAFGVERLVIAGDKDENLLNTLAKVNSEWGGNLQLKLIPYDDWKTFIHNWKADTRKRIVHLTMYGENLSIFEKSKEFLSLKKLSQGSSDLLVVVGGEKIPGKVFKIADWNIAISNQPHSEVASLAVFLDHIKDNALQIQFSNAIKQIIPSMEGNKILLGNRKNGK
ncbi:MAG: tRNA (cytidine(56)-2'-O)-methyltransferase [Candidatus Heimdallarchaeota archaeon]|nr:MAG: tRNA (cytidine(56)-2'-O)-methyltransferase [Candidatus Heimdallarchaeota archaeon]